MTYPKRSRPPSWLEENRSLINWLFRDPHHCAMAYISEMNGTQNAKEYRNG